MTRILNIVRQQSIAFVALLVALGGTGYAATQLPAGSVGTKQLRNSAVTPPSLPAGRSPGRSGPGHTTMLMARCWPPTVCVGEWCGARTGSTYSG